MNDVYVVAATGPWNRTVFEEMLAPRSGTWVFVGARDELTSERLKSAGPRYVFFLHWSWRVSPDIFTAYECIGFHMTDLPYGRGGSPLQNLILRGHRTTMLTAFRIGEVMDAGSIYLKAALSLDGRAEDIYVRASRLAATLIGQIIEQQPVPIPQDGEVVEFHRRSPADSRIPEAATPEQLYDFIRMLDADGYPRAFADWGGYRCEFRNASLENGVVCAEARIVASHK